MDFTQPDAPIDGTFTRVLFVRDLASGCTLLAKPCMSESSEVTVNALTGLFAIFGPPLVLKSDNGSAFASEEVQLLLTQNSVIPLFSPPYWPRYNGGAAKGSGSARLRCLTPLRAIHREGVRHNFELPKLSQTPWHLEQQ